MEEKQDKLKIIKDNSDISWFIADKWFRILEFSFILGTLHYFSETINNRVYTVIYWISWILFWSWFEDIGKLITEFIYARYPHFTKIKRLLVFVLCTAFIILIYFFVTHTVDSIINKEHLIR